MVPVGQNSVRCVVVKSLEKKLPAESQIKDGFGSRVINNEANAKIIQERGQAALPDLRGFLRLCVKSEV